MVALPPLQPRVLSADLGGGHDVAGRVQFGEAESLADRAGVRLSYQTRTLNAWARLAFSSRRALLMLVETVVLRSPRELLIDVMALA